MKKKATVLLLATFLLVFAMVPRASAQATISITKPLVEYEAATQTIDITGVNATCTNHGILTSSDAIVHTWTLYYNDTAYAGLAVVGFTGDLAWNNSFWNAFNIDVSILPPGRYHVDVTFNDTDVASVVSADSDYFTIPMGTTGGGGPHYWPFLFCTDFYCRTIIFIFLVIIMCFVVFIAAIWPTRGKSRVKR